MTAPRINRIDLYAVDLPFRKPFHHAAIERSASDSLFLRLSTDTGHDGIGESLPRGYVTGETRDETFELLRERILPNLFELSFENLDAVTSFLWRCNGKAPCDWLAAEVPQTAAWCSVDLALLDTFGHVFDQQIHLGPAPTQPATWRCSAVVSSEARASTLMLIRLAGIRQVKLKVDGDTTAQRLRKCRRILGRHCDIRVDVNMAWTVDEAVASMAQLARFGIRSFEQPVAAHDLAGLARLVSANPGCQVMVDESMHDEASLDALIEHQACSAANVRISKCGGLVAAWRRCQEVLEANLTLQVGCQTGESSLLSAAQLTLLNAVPHVKYIEGCFGRHLLRADPVTPTLQFGWKGRPPQRPRGPGFGVKLDDATLERCTTHRATLVA